MENRRCAGNLALLEEIGFRISWTLLRLGYHECGFVPPMFSQKDICGYAAKCIEAKKDQDIRVAMLLGAEKDGYEFAEILNDLARSEAVDVELQSRKLRALFLYGQFSALPDDYENGLMELYQVWGTLGFPDDCPFQAWVRDRLLTATEDYTQSTYEALKRANFEWLYQETASIIRQEQPNNCSPGEGESR